LNFPNLAWAIRERGSQYELAAQLGESESWVSRRLTGRVKFSDKERQRIARELGYPVEWLFQIVVPPTVESDCPPLEGA
jgi:transcriptional regulator with XRE-family HTH domain